MTVRAFSGGAGCGKTYQLMHALSQYLLQTPLKSGQKVLALTFMHGSRRRLDERLNSVPGLLGKYECATIDSFAWRIVRRWRTMAEQFGFVGISVNEYERVGEAVATLLELNIVAKWVAATFPILLVDEAQDLTPVRLRIVMALACHLDVLIAADEFQCLDSQLRPNPACEWLVNSGALVNLTVQKRTNIAELFQAASAIRIGQAPVSNKFFSIALTPNPALAGTWLTHAIAWYGGGKKVAIITPTDKGFARKVIDWVAANTTKKGLGPYSIKWEKSESSAAEDFLNNLVLPVLSNAAQVTEAIEALGNLRVKSDMLSWLDVQRRVRGCKVFTIDEIALAVNKSFSDQRRGQRNIGPGIRAMTVHGAKNREFDNVIVIWPAAVVKEENQRRRLLYNAITRAKYRCLVLVQAKSSLQSAPFV